MTGKLHGSKRLFAVVQLQNKIRTAECLTAAQESGADGAFVIFPCRPELTALMAEWYADFAGALPESFWLGLSLSGYSPIGAVNAIKAMGIAPMGLWVKSPRRSGGDPLCGADVAWNILRQRAQTVTQTLLFGSLDPQVKTTLALKDIARVTRRAAQSMSAVVTDVDFNDPLAEMKLSTMRFAAGNALLAIEADPRPHEMDTLRKYGEIFLIPRSEESRSTDWVKMRELAEIVHAR